MLGPYTVGVDVGGTKILGGLLDCESGEIISIVKTSSPPVGADPIVAAIEETIAKVLAAAPGDVAKRVAGIGLGVAGQVDPAQGLLRAAPNLGGGISNVALRAPLQARFGVPIALGNDVEVAAIGESHFGAGKGVPLFACVFVGTGIGGALMQSGVRFRGATGSAGEIGHIMVRAGGRMCGCGQRGHLEAYASRTAIVAMMREAVEGGEKSSLSNLLLDTSQRVKSKPLSEAVASGDPLAVNTITQAGLHLGLGLASLINLWNPLRIILGGGVIDRIDLLFKVAAEQARSAALVVPAGTVEIVRAALGDNSGMVGAAILANTPPMRD
ncbi:MAG TPA: ROK family protein [Chloroflexia bacterium]|nr:ROK family protein [Chloroflexia bacterium]